MGELDDRIRAQVARAATLPFSRFMEMALYTPGLGFYEAAGRAGGRSGDFVTSVETGTLFAAVVGEWLDRTWDDLGQPDPFHVVEAGAGVGTLWRGIHKAAPRCLEALSYVLVERSAEQRRKHRELPGTVASLGGLGALAGGPAHAIVANELLDNLVFDIVQIGDDGSETPVHVAERAGELTLEPLDGLGADPTKWLPDPIGANAWLSEATSVADRVLCLDYAAPSGELVHRGAAGWLRTYAGHQRGSDPLAATGTCDITADVPVDRLEPAPTIVATQADFLRDLGIETRVETARRTWEERRGIGDLEALFARSAVTEAQALLDPAGLGGFLAMEWR